MKKWTGILVSLIVLLLIAYYVMGMVVESTLNKNIKAFPKNPIMTVQLDKYQRGWFSSEAILTVKMHIPEQKTTNSSGVNSTSESVDFELDFPLIIHHGPFICSKSGVRLGMGQVTTKPETHYGVLINYLNKTIIRYTFPSFAVKAKTAPSNDNFQFEWKGITSMLSVSSNVDQVDGHFDFLGLNGSAKVVTFNADGIFNHLNMSKVKEGLWVGSFNMDVPSITASMPGNKPFALEGFSYKVASDVQGNAFNLSFDLSLKKLLVDNKNYGPGVLKIAIKNLDADAIAKINQKEMDLIGSGGDPDLNALALFYELPKLLTLGPEVEVPELNLNLPQGQVIGNFKLSLAKSDHFDPNQIMQNTKGEGQLKAPIEVVKALMLSAIKDNLKNQTPATAPKTDSQTTPQVEQSTPQVETQVKPQDDSQTTPQSGSQVTPQDESQATTQGESQVTPQDESQIKPQVEQQSTLQTRDTDTSTQSSNVSAPVDIDVEAQKQLDALLEKLISKGYLKVEGNDYVIQFNLENQQLKLNGNPLDPSVFQ